MTQKTHNGVVTHLVPDILEYKAKWALGSITTSKTSENDGISAGLFQILKDDAVKVFHSICRKFGKLSRGHRIGNGQSQRRPMPNNIQITAQFLSFHMLQRPCSKYFKLSFNSTWTKNLQIYKLDLEKTEEPEIIEKAREFQKKHLLLLH